LFILLGDLLWRGGPAHQTADVALITLSARDLWSGHALVGPYSRFGWHHPGPAEFVGLAFPTLLARGAPVGAYLGATLLNLGWVVGGVEALRRSFGRVAAWGGVAGVASLIVAVDPIRWRNPWNPYVAALPVLVALVGAAAAVVGVRGAGWVTAIAGSVAVQSQLSSLPAVLVAWAVVAVAVGVGRKRRERTRGTRRVRWARWVRWVGAAVLVALWAGPLWDEAWGTANLSAIGRFLLRSGGDHPWSEAWRTTATVASAVRVGRRVALADERFVTHPLVVAAAWAAAASALVLIARRIGKPFATALVAVSGAAALVGAVSILGVAGPVHRYLVLWMVVLPVPLVIAMAVLLVDARRAARLAVAGVALGAAALACVFSARAAAARTESDHSVAVAWALVAPRLDRGPVRIELDDGSAWPVAAGLALDLETHGHGARVGAEWTKFFGSHRLATGRERTTVVLATPATRPPDASELGWAGDTWVGWRPGR